MKTFNPRTRGAIRSRRDTPTHCYPTSLFEDDDEYSLPDVAPRFALPPAQSRPRTCSAIADVSRATRLKSASQARQRSRSLTRRRRKRDSVPQEKSAELRERF
jgi:hypothetical protein